MAQHNKSWAFTTKGKLTVKQKKGGDSSSFFNQGAENEP